MEFQSSSMVIAGLFGAGIFLGWNTVKEVDASVVYVDPLSIEYDRSREDKAFTAWHSGNYGIAVSLWRLRAEYDADAQYGLGVAYSEAKGVSPNLETAVSWFLKAANQQHLYAMFNAGKELNKLTHHVLTKENIPRKLQNRKEGEEVKPETLSRSRVRFRLSRSS